MINMLALEVSVEQIADAVHRMSPAMRHQLVTLASELGASQGWVTTITYHPEEQGYLGHCLPIDVVAWGATPAEVRADLIDAVVETALVLVEDTPNPGPELATRVPYAQIIYQHRESPEVVAELLGLTHNAFSSTMACAIA